MYKIAYTQKKRPGKCKLCFKFVERLEGHHISYNPEIKIDLCHKCHFIAHFKPERLTDTQKFLLLNKVMPVKEANKFIKEHGKDRVKLARAFAPSRRQAIRDSQRDFRQKRAHTIAKKKKKKKALRINKPHTDHTMSFTCS